MDEKIFAAVTLDSKGNILGRQKVGDCPPDDEAYFSRRQKLGEGKYMIPVYSTSSGISGYRMRMVRYIELSVN